MVYVGARDQYNRTYQAAQNAQDLATRGFTQQQAIQAAANEANISADAIEAQLAKGVASSNPQSYGYSPGKATAEGQNLVPASKTIVPNSGGQVMTAYKVGTPAELAEQAYKQQAMQKYNEIKKIRAAEDVGKQTALNILKKQYPTSEVTTKGNKIIVTTKPQQNASYGPRISSAPTKPDSSDLIWEAIKKDYPGVKTWYQTGNNSYYGIEGNEPIFLNQNGQPINFPMNMKDQPKDIMFGEPNFYRETGKELGRQVLDFISSTTVGAGKAANLNNLFGDNTRDKLRRFNPLLSEAYETAITPIERSARVQGKSLNVQGNLALDTDVQTAATVSGLSLLSLVPVVGPAVGAGFLGYALAPSTPSAKKTAERIFFLTPLIAKGATEGARAVSKPLRYMFFNYKLNRWESKLPKYTPEETKTMLNVGGYKMPSGEIQTTFNFNAELKDWFPERKIQLQEMMSSASLKRPQMPTKLTVIEGSVYDNTPPILFLEKPGKIDNTIFKEFVPTYTKIRTDLRDKPISIFFKEYQQTLTGKPKFKPYDPYTSRPMVQIPNRELQVSKGKGVDYYGKFEDSTGRLKLMQQIKSASSAPGTEPSALSPEGFTFKKGYVLETPKESNFPRDVFAADYEAKPTEVVKPKVTARNNKTLSGIIPMLGKARENRILATTKSNIINAQRSNVGRISIQSTFLGQIPISNSMISQDTIQSTNSILGLVSIQDQAQDTLTRQRQEQKSLQVSDLLRRERVIERQITKERLNTDFFRSNNRPSDNENKQQRDVLGLFPEEEPGYYAAIKRTQQKLGKGKYRSKGYEVINKEPLTRAAAMNLLMEKIDRYTNRSGKIVAAHKKAAFSQEQINTALLSKFRRAKHNANVLVEKSNYAIDSYEEKQGIPYEALRQRKKQQIQNLLTIRQKKTKRKAIQMVSNFIKAKKKSKAMKWL